MATPEQIKAFEGQIERSIDLRADQLGQFSEKKAKAVRSLKSTILGLAKKDRDNPDTPEKEEKYSADLKLDRAELTSILKDVLAKHPQLCADNDIKSLDNFKTYLGLANEEIVYVDSLNKVTLFGRPIRLRQNFNTSKDLAKNYAAALKKIEGKEDLGKYITQETEFNVHGGARIEFAIERDGGIVKYTASPEGVFRIDKEASVKQMKIWASKSDEIRKAKRDLNEELGQDEKLNDAQKELIRRMINADYDEYVDEYLDDYRKSIAQEIGSDFQVPPKYKELIEKKRALYRDTIEMVSFCSLRMLLDEQTGGRIEEFGSPGRSGLGKFEYIYLTNGGKKSKGVQYLANKRHSVTDYDENEKTVKALRYREDGTIESRRILNVEDRYDKNGNANFRVIFDKEGGVEVAGVIGEDGKLIERFEYEKLADPKMTQAKYLRKFNSIIKTPDQFYAFEENELVEETDDSLILKLRQRGRKITGLDKQEKALEDRYGIKIETEVSSHPECENERHTIRNLVLEMRELAAACAKYPPGFIEATGLVEIEIFTGWASKGKKGNNTTAGGMSFDSGKIGIENVGKSFDHELYHCADNTYGGYYNENAEWGEQAHGHGYKEIYGESGTDAMVTGKAYGPRPKGHASAYAKHGGIDEDQAETGEALMMNKKVLAFATSEPALAMKVKMAKEFYYALSGGKMDAIFWKDIGSGKTIDDAYWQGREKANDFMPDAGGELAIVELPNINSMIESLKAKKIKKAYVALDNLIANNPEKSRIYHRLALDRLSLILPESPRKREKILLELVQRYPDEPVYHSRLGKTYNFGLKNKKEAIRHYNLAIDKGSTQAVPYYDLHMIYNRHKDYAKRVEVCKKWIESAQNPNADAYSIVAKAYIKSGEEEKAAEIFRKGIEKSPNNSALKIEFARMYHESDPTKAREMYEKYIADDPGNLDYHMKLIHLHRAEGRSYDMGRVCEESMDKVEFEGNYDFHKRVIYNYNTQQETRSATELYEAKLDADPNNPDLYTLLGMLYEVTDEGKAYDNYKLAAENKSTRPTAYYWLANHHGDRGEVDEQIKILEDGIKNVDKNKISNGIPTELGDIYLQKGLKDKAIEAYEIAAQSGRSGNELVEYLYYSHEGNLQKAVGFHFEYEMNNPNYDTNTYKHQAELARFYGRMIKESLKENFDHKVQIDQDFLIENSDIGLLHSEMTAALEKACGSSKARRRDYIALSKAYSEQGQYEMAEQVMREASAK